MATLADIRKIARALEGVSEVEHWGRPAFRTKKRIFAVHYPDGLYLHLPAERKEFLFEAAPEIFIKYMWGKTVNVKVKIEKVSKTELATLLAEGCASATSPKRSGERPRRLNKKT